MRLTQSDRTNGRKVTSIWKTMKTSGITTITPTTTGLRDFRGLLRINCLKLAEGLCLFRGHQERNDWTSRFVSHALNSFLHEPSGFSSGCAAWILSFEWRRVFHLRLHCHLHIVRASGSQNSSCLLARRWVSWVETRWRLSYSGAVSLIGLNANLTSSSDFTRRV